MVLVVHGLGDYSSRGIFAQQTLMQSGLHVHGLDLEGFGRSEGRHGYIKEFEVLVGDLIAYIKAIKEEGKPLFLVGG